MKVFFHPVNLKKAGGLPPYISICSFMLLCNIIAADVGGLSLISLGLDYVKEHKEHNLFPKGKKDLGLC